MLATGLTALCLFAAVLVHVMGRLVAAKSSGIGVISVKIFLGHTVYTIWVGNCQLAFGCIPLGAYLVPARSSFFEKGALPRHFRRLHSNLLQKPEAESYFRDPRTWFCGKPWYARWGFAASGLLANLSVATLALYAGVSYHGVRIDDRCLVQSTETNSVAEKAGLQRGDRIVAVDHQPVPRWENALISLRGLNSRDVQLTVLRDEDMKLELVLKSEHLEHKLDTKIYTKLSQGVCLHWDLPSVTKAHATKLLTKVHAGI